MDRIVGIGQRSPGQYARRRQVAYYCGGVSDDALFDIPPYAPASSTASSGSLTDAQHAATPLAVRMRPRTLDELVGQPQLLAPGSPLRQLVEAEQPGAVLLWGPPGTGKTTIAAIISATTDRDFVEVSAVSAGVKQVREIIDRARQQLARGERQTVMFVDEVHRFTKAQQDALLPGVENRWITMVAATTENPFFSVISPLLSRCLLLTLTPLTDADIEGLVRAATTDPRGLDGAFEIDNDALEYLIRLSGGDARRALTYLEAASETARGHDVKTIDLDTLEVAVDRAAVRYDRDGDQHYDVISAFIKSIRGSDPDAALHYLARMLEAGEDPRFIARRLVISASEDIGLADPTALPTAVAAAQAVQLIGLPEARLNLAQAVIALALAPKSNAVITAIDAASADVRAGNIGTVPAHLRDAHYPGAARLGHGERYRYPHDEPLGVSEQQYAPDVVADRRYYHPTRHGAEGEYASRWERIRALLRSEAADESASPESDTSR
jgi:putative ATPase